VRQSQEFEYDVFLSHSAKDKAVVRPLAERLRADGLKVWFDEWVLKPGDNILAKIEAGLEHSRVLVLCMSAQAFGSDWAKLEAGTFRFRDPLNRERRFIPLRLDDAPIKGSLAQFLYINWLPADREQEYVRLLTACKQPESWPLATTKNSPSLKFSTEQAVVYHRSKPRAGFERQVILRCRAMERFALAWLLADQLPSGGWGRSLVPWMKANWKGYSIAPDPLMEEEGGFESSILAFHVLYHCRVRGENMLPRQVLSRFKTYLDRHHDPATWGFGTRSVSREGMELSVRLRHTALGAYGLLLLNQIERRTVERQITRTLHFLLRQQGQNYSDDRNGCLLYALLDFLSSKITVDGIGPFDAYRPPPDITQALHDWRQEHEPTMRHEFLRSEYQPFDNKTVPATCDPWLVPYGGFSRMVAYTFLTTCQFATENLPPEVQQRLCHGLLALLEDYRGLESASPFSSAISWLS
jgi:hypothetical protein